MERELLGVARDVPDGVPMTRYVASAALDEQLRRQQQARRWYERLPDELKAITDEHNYVKRLCDEWDLVHPLTWTEGGDAKAK